MNAQSFVTLALVTLSAVALAFVTSAYSGLGDAIDSRGTAIAPNLINQAQGVTRIEVDAGDGPMVFERKDGAFRDTSGYPAKPAVIRDLVAGLALMTIEERKTDEVDRLDDLDLAKPGLPGGGDGVVLKTSSGSIVADVVLGARDSTLGGTRGGQYVRRGGTNQAYLARGSVTPPVSRVEWLETKLADLKPSELVGITAQMSDATRFDTIREADGLKLVNVPAGRTAATDELGKLERLVGPLRFTDVRPAENADIAPQGPTLKATTRDGLTLTVQQLQPVSRKPVTDTVWVRVTASAAAQANAGADQTKASDARRKRVEARVAAINARTTGYEFKLSSADTTLLMATSDDLLAAPDAANSAPATPTLPAGQPLRSAPTVPGLPAQ